ncbi:MAG: hypothetical protein NC394_08440 [Bacteroides sp.]|nr:hypothetical protein [Bacteroides sp.]
MYKVKRTKKFYDTLQLCDEQGNAQKELKIEVDIDAVATGFREVLARLEKAEKGLHDKQSLNQQKDFDKAYYDYGAALVKMFEMCFGKENTEAIVTFFENRYTEMSVELVPYITKEIIPLVGEAIKQRKAELKKAGKR